MIKDLKVCGRREYANLLRLHHKYQNIIRNEKFAKEKKAKEESKIAEPVDEDAELDKQLEATLLRIQKEKKKQEKKEKIIQAKNDLKKKMSVIASSGIDGNDEDLMLSKKIWDKLHAKGFDGLGEKTDSDESSEEEESSDEYDDEEGEDSDESVDSKKARIDQMADEFEQQIKQQREYAMTVDRRAAKAETKKKSLIESQRLNIEDVSDEEALDNQDLMQHKLEKSAPQYIEGHDIESSGSSSDSDDSDTAAKSRFINPLLAAKQNKQEASDDEWSDESDDDEKVKGKKKDKKSLLGKRSRKDKDVDNVKDFFKSEQFDVVPADDPATLQEAGYESMDSDEIAETRILAKKMLRKKTRNAMIEASYNRFTTHEDPATLPSWFVEDEAKNRYQIHFTPTKEEMQAEKEALKAYNARPSKKVEQAKMRKKKRLAKAMEKVKKKAQVIADTDLNEASKMKQIQKLYAKEKAKHKEEKSYVVSRNFNSPQGAKFGRNTKVVDPRLKKDQRNKKFKAKHPKGRR